uniref:Uncharacterized protein n=1 Tax=Rhizophora mucronata TaxID=61149 RepID=A0A2P2Q160_RHIMU
MYWKTKIVLKERAKLKWRNIVIKIGCSTLSFYSLQKAKPLSK